MPHESIHGFYVADESGFSNCIAKSRRPLDEPQVRYVLCKQIFHGILHNNEINTTDVYAHLDEIAVTFPVRDSEPGPAVKSEHLAEVGAMEFLFPYRVRVKELAAANGQRTKEVFARIAEKYLVEIYLHPISMEDLGAMDNGILMAARANSKTTAAQSARLIEAAKKIGADVSGKTFEKAKKIV